MDHDADADADADYRRNGTAICTNEDDDYPLDKIYYIFLDEIGRGVNSIVHKALCIGGSLLVSFVAIKVIDLKKSKPGFESKAKNIPTLPLDHPNILRPHCIFTVENSLWVVMPLVSGGSLQSSIATGYPHGLPEDCIVVVLLEILNALSYLHDQGHHHRDIKPGNILIDSTNGSVKLADFGVSASLSTMSASSTESYETSGTPYWVAPEVVKYTFAVYVDHGKSADIWSLGITALELFYGRSPLSHIYTYRSVTKILRLTEPFKDMVGACLNLDPLKRPTAERLLKHTLFEDSKASDFLIIMNMMKGVPELENRSEGPVRNNRLRRRTNKDEGNDHGYLHDRCSSSGEVVKERITSGWSFDAEGFELEPDFPDDYGEICDAAETLVMIKPIEATRQYVFDGEEGEGVAASHSSYLGRRHLRHGKE